MLFIHRRASGALHVDCSFEYDIFGVFKIYFTTRLFIYLIVAGELSTYVCLNIELLSV